MRKLPETPKIQETQTWIKFQKKFHILESYNLAHISDLPCLYICSDSKFKAPKERVLSDLFFDRREKETSNLPHHTLHQRLRQKNLQQCAVWWWLLKHKKADGLARTKRGSTVRNWKF